MTLQIITIDGPVASGKGTIAKLVAKELAWAYLDSGALYRLLALLAKNNNVILNDEDALVTLAKNIRFQFIDDRTYLNDQNVTQIIRQEEIGLIASEIAVFPKVRQALLIPQTELAKQSNLVAEGRDMGSIVFPTAQLKVYLTASVEIRVKRRARQLGVDVDSDAYQQIYQTILDRDNRDKNRSVAPLIPAKGARIIDSSQLNMDQITKKIISWYQELSK